MPFLINQILAINKCLLTYNHTVQSIQLPSVDATPGEPHGIVMQPQGLHDCSVSIECSVHSTGTYASTLENWLGLG